jgi:hypothetical protein
MAAVLSSELDAIAVETLQDIWLASFVRNHPFLDRMARKKAGGSGYRIPVQTGPGGGASGNFGDSLGNSSANGFTGVGFTVKPAIAYGTTRIQWQDQAYSDTPQSPVDIAMNASKNCLALNTENLANMLLGSASGAAGAYAEIADVSGPTGSKYLVTLTVQTDASKFNLEQVVNTKATATSALDAGYGIVTGRNQIGGQIEIDVGATGLVPTTGHIIGLQGQLPAGSDTSGLFASVLQWVPPAANRTNGIVGGTFLGVTRTASSDVVATSGWAFDGSSVPIFQAVYATSAYMQNNSKLAKPDTYFVNPLVLVKMAQECGQDIRYDMKSVNGVDVGFAGFTIVLPTGKCDVLSEPSMPITQTLLTKSGTWEFAPPGGGEIFRPATNGKMIIDDFGDSSNKNQSRCTTMATGFFGCNDLNQQAIITVGLGEGLNL